MNEEKHTAGESFRFQVNLGGMLDILSNHLYKSPDVFLRELLQNGADAITLRQKRQPGWTGGSWTRPWACCTGPVWKKPGPGAIG